jgi:hypothetical protein
MTYVLTILSSESRQKNFARASPRAVWMKIKQSIRRSKISQAGSGRMSESIRTKWAGIGRLARPITRTAWKAKLSTDVSQAKLVARDGQKLTELTLHKNWDCWDETQATTRQSSIGREISIRVTKFTATRLRRLARDSKNCSQTRISNKIRDSPRR